MRSIYEFPEIFRAVHMEAAGEIAEETKFLRKIWKRHAKRPIRRVLDIACGNSPHGQILAGGGIEVAGVDRSRTMIAAGEREARGLPLKLYRRRIENFAIPESPFDAAIFMSETFPVMIDNAAIKNHFKSVGQLLRRDALYCIDIDRHDGARTVKERRLWRRREVNVGEIVVEIEEYSRPLPWFAACHSIYELNCRIHFPDRIETTQDLVPIRYTTPNLLEFAAEASGFFKMTACYADYSISIPMARCDRRWLAVLRRV
jgi:SAM-dependent methyltransferase